MRRWARAASAATSTPSARRRTPRAGSTCWPSCSRPARRTCSRAGRRGPRRAPSSLGCGPGHTTAVAQRAGRCADRRREVARAPRGGPGPSGPGRGIHRGGRHAVAAAGRARGRRARPVPADPSRRTRDALALWADVLPGRAAGWCSTRSPRWTAPTRRCTATTTSSRRSSATIAALDVGGRLAGLGAAAGLTVVAADVVAWRPDPAAMAGLHVLNLRTWRDDPFIADGVAAFRARRARRRPRRDRPRPGLRAGRAVARRGGPGRRLTAGLYRTTPQRRLGAASRLTTSLGRREGGRGGQWRGGRQTTRAPDVDGKRSGRQPGGTATMSPAGPAANTRRDVESRTRRSSSSTRDPGDLLAQTAGLELQLEDPLDGRFATPAVGPSARCPGRPIWANPISWMAI